MLCEDVFSWFADERNMRAIGTIELVNIEDIRLKEKEMYITTTNSVRY